MTNPLVLRSKYNKLPIKSDDGVVDVDWLTREHGKIESALSFATSLASNFANPVDFGADPRGFRDSTLAFKEAMATGRVLIPPGRFRLTDSLPIQSGLIMVGAGNTNFYYGNISGTETPTLLFMETANTPIFTAGSVYDVSLSHFVMGAGPFPYPQAISVVPRSGTYGIAFEGEYPADARNIGLSFITMYDFDRAISVVDPNAGGMDPDWNCCPVTLRSCVFHKNNHGVYFDTSNADAWLFDTCEFNLTANGAGVTVHRAGYLTFLQCLGGGYPGFSTTNTAMVRVSGPARDTLNFITCQYENATAMLEVVAGAQVETFRPLIFNGCLVEAPVLLDETCRFESYGSRYTESVNVSGDDIVVVSYGDSFDGAADYVITGTDCNVSIGPPNAVRAVTTTTTAALRDTAIYADATAGAITVNLPSANLATVGKQYVIKKIDASANAVTVDADGTDLIDGAASATLGFQYEAVTVQSDGSDWWII